MPFFPLGGFSPLHATPISVALAWLLRRSPDILLIPGTSSVRHLRENVAGGGLSLGDEDVAELEKIGGQA
ncbi:aldo/keto reductase [Nonomuraea sp. K271]|uniref:aldo/keto reductase n=1 Tax=Nonomuraea sp. K271 TaxID=1848319 RepID=UPI003FA5F135